MMIRSLLLIALLVNFVDAASTDYRIESIFDLDVGGTLYDVDYIYDTTWGALAIASGLSTQAEAAAFANAVRDALNPLAIPAPSGAADFSTDLLHVWQVSNPQVFTVDTFRSGNDPLVYSVTDFNPIDQNFGPRVGWAQVTLADPVPAPASLALFGLGLAGLGFSRRQRG